MTEQLLLSIEARTALLERQMRKASGVVGKNFDGMEKRSKRAASTIERHFAGIGTGMLAGFASAISVRAAQQLIDTSTRIGNSLKVARLAGNDLKKVYDRLFASAQRNAAPLESLAQLYSRVSLVQGELGASTDDMLKFTDNVAMALRVAGTDAQSASGALLQLSQAMGSGVVRAEEFNSILEGALPIAQAAAAGLDEAGGSVAKLRQLVVDGKISSKAFFDAFEAGSVTLQDKVAGSEVTVSSSFVRLQNVLIDAAGRFNDTSHAGQRFANFLDRLGTSITNLANSPSFDKLLTDFFDEGARRFAGDMRDIERIGQMVESVKNAFTDVNAEVNITASQAANAQAALEAFAIANSGVFSPDVEAAFRDLINQLSEGKGSAEDATTAIMAMGTADPNFDKVIGKVSILVNTFIGLRDAATAALMAAGGAPAAVSASDLARGKTPPKSAPPVTPVTLADYPITPTTGMGGGGGGHSASSTRAETDAAKELIAELENELRVIGMSEVEKRIDAELRRAGASATDAQKQSIRGLVTEIDAQNAALERTQDAMEGAKGLAKDFLGGLMSDLMSGTDAATALANAFSNLASKLMDMALNSLIESLFSSLVGGAGSFFGFSGGGEVRAATGGLIRGPGTATSDSIPARLSDGEFVVNAAATRRNLDLLRAVNDGKVAAFATGGLVGDSPALRAANDNIGHANDNAAPVVAISAPITVNGSAGTPEQNTDLAKRMRREMEAGMRTVVADELRKQTKAGNMLNTRGR